MKRRAAVGSHGGFTLIEVVLGAGDRRPHLPDRIHCLSASRQQKRGQHDPSQPVLGSWWGFDWCWVDTFQPLAS
jgi:hypothetical protein